MHIEHLTLAQARRIALAAQGFAAPRPARAGKRHLLGMIRRLGVVQIDSVNVLARAHTLPGFSRLGNYDTADLDRLAYAGRKRKLFEYWGHEASYLPVEIHPLIRWRMERAARGEGIYGRLANFARERPDVVDAMRREFEVRGPLAAGELGEGKANSGGWWGWSDAKHAAEYLFWAGEISTATRRRSFERVYDLTERVLPPEILALPTPPEREAHKALIRIAAGALGVATSQCLRDYFRLKPADALPAIAELLEDGALVQASVAGWDRPAYMAPDVLRPRAIKAHALLAPFDPLIWQRERTQALFGARVRLEIYTVAHKRVHGYYVLPFLMGEKIAARLDLKADRAAGRLLVLAAHLEPGADPQAVAQALHGELHLMAQWLGLDAIDIAGSGDLSPLLARAVG
jgi:uncharacterized protein YcaQ